MSASAQILRRKSKEKRKFRSKNFKRNETTTAPSCPRALESDLVDFPSIIIREGKSLNLWINKYWPSYFSEVFENGAPNTDPVMNAKFKKDFMNRFSEYVSSECNDEDLKKSFDVTVTPKENRKWANQRSSKKTSWVDATKALTKERVSERVPDSIDHVFFNDNFATVKRGVRLKVSDKFNDSNNQIKIAENLTKSKNESSQNSCKNNDENHSFKSNSQHHKSVKIKTNYAERTIPIAPEVPNVQRHSFRNCKAINAFCDQTKATYRRSLSFASEIAHKAKLMRDRRKQRKSSTGEERELLESRFVSLPPNLDIIDSIGSEDLKFTDGFFSLPSRHDIVNSLDMEHKIPKDIFEKETNLNVSEEKAGWVLVGDLQVHSEESKTDSKTNSKLPAFKANNLLHRPASSKLTEDSSLGSSFNVNWSPLASSPMSNQFTKLVNPHSDDINIKESKVESESSSKSHHIELQRFQYFDAFY